jgi:hypothetical protein
MITAAKEIALQKSRLASSRFSAFSCVMQAASLSTFVHTIEERRSLWAKFSVLPQREETAAQMSERGTLAVYSERLVLSCRQLVVRRHRCGGAPSARALGSVPVHIPELASSLPPSPNR